MTTGKDNASEAAPGHPRCGCGMLSQTEVGLCLSCAVKELNAMPDEPEARRKASSVDERAQLERFVMRYRTALQAIEAWGFHKFRPGDASSGWENECSHVTPDRMRHCGAPSEKHPVAHDLAVYAQKMLDDGRAPGSTGGATQMPSAADLGRAVASLLIENAKTDMTRGYNEAVRAVLSLINLGECFEDDPSTMPRAESTRDGSSFSWDTVDGEIAYSAETEEWTLAGKVEGRMSGLVARQVLAKCVAPDVGSPVLQAGPSSGAESFDCPHGRMVSSGEGCTTCKAVQACVDWVRAAEGDGVAEDLARHMAAQFTPAAPGRRTEEKTR